VDIPSRKSLALHLEKAYESMITKLKETLEEVSKVSTTADICTSHNRSYLGKTFKKHRLYNRMIKSPSDEIKLKYKQISNLV